MRKFQWNRAKNTGEFDNQKPRFLVDKHQCYHFLVFETFFASGFETGWKWAFQFLCSLFSFTGFSNSFMKENLFLWDLIDMGLWKELCIVVFRKFSKNISENLRAIEFPHYSLFSRTWALCLSCRLYLEDPVLDLFIIVWASTCSYSNFDFSKSLDTVAWELSMGLVTRLFN